MSRNLTLLFAAVALLSLETICSRPAFGQVWVDADHLDGKLPEWVDPAYVRPTPIPSIEYRVWVEPVYRIVSRRVWVEPVVRVEYERVWIPPREEWRETVYWEDGVKVVRRERICVEPGHWESRRREIVVSPGHWEIVEQRELVREGSWTR